MNTNTQLLTSLQQEIFRLLCKNVGNPLNQRTISSLLKVSPAGITKALPQLEKQRYLDIKKDNNMNLNLVELSLTTHILQLKRAENLRALYETKITELLEDTYQGCTIILFGSYSRGDDTYKSDIDIAVIGSKAKNINLEEFEKKLQKPININNYKDWKSIHNDLKENLCNGIVLVGGIRL